MRTHKKAFLLSAATLLAVLGLPACRAGETARFSDVPVARKPLTQDQADILRMRRLQQFPVSQGAATSRPSLQGVTGPRFFAPRSTEGRVLTPRELELLDQNKNWIFQDPSQTGLTEENLHEALGVRSLENEAGGDTGSEEPKTAMERFIENRQERDQTAGGQESPEDAAAPTSWMHDAASTPPTFELHPAAEALRDDPLYTELIGLGDQMDPELEQALRAAREANRELRDTLQQAARGQVFGGLESRSLGESLRPGGPSSRSQRGLDGLLDSGNSLPSPVGPRVGSVLDPVNAYPDLTRQELAPVVAPPGGAGESFSPKPVFSDPQNARSSMARGLGGGISDLLRPSAGGRSLMPALSNPQNSLQPVYSPSKSMRLKLDLPGRTF